MLVSEFVRNVVLLSEGKRESFATGSTKWLRIVDQGNFFLQSFARERGIDWNIYYNPVKSFGAVTATATFAIPSTVQKISQQEGDSLRITHTNGVSYTDYTFVNPDKLQEKNTGNYVARIGSNVKFNIAFTATSPQFGGTITVPVYEYPAVFSADADVISIPDPAWLVYMVAGDRVKNDVTRKDLRADLIAQANESMLAMKEDNESGLSELLMSWDPLDGIGEDWF